MLLCFLWGCAHTGEEGAGFSGAVADSRNRPLRIAVLPVENLSGGVAPLRDLRSGLIEQLARQGIEVVDDGTLESVVKKHRIRYIGGLSVEMAKGFREDAAVDAVLVTSLETYFDGGPPKIALLCRLVATTELPAIVWMESVGLAGDDSPGFLGLGLIEDERVLWEKALRIIARSLTKRLASGPEIKAVQPVAAEPEPPIEIPFGSVWTPRATKRPEEPQLPDAAFLEKFFKEGDEVAVQGPRRLRPRISYRTPFRKEGAPLSVAVMPFVNWSQKQDAGVLVSLHLVRRLAGEEGFAVLEPGVVRSHLLQRRIILREGVSLPDVDLIGNSMDVDLLVIGKVITYEEPRGLLGTPRVNFSIVVIERATRKIVWAANSYNNGDDGVFFFEAGRFYMANTLASAMAGVVAEQLGR